MRMAPRRERHVHVKKPIEIIVPACKCTRHRGDTESVGSVNSRGVQLRARDLRLPTLNVRTLNMQVRKSPQCMRKSCLWQILVTLYKASEDPLKQPDPGGENALPLQYGGEPFQLPHDLMASIFFGLQYRAACKRHGSQFWFLVMVAWKQRLGLKVS